MCYYFSLFVVFSVGALVLAAPTDKKPTCVDKEDVKLGCIYWPRLKHLEPKDSKPTQVNRRHPVVVVGDVDAQDKVKVAQISSHPRAHQWGSVEPASNYADLEGFINVGLPNTVHVAHLPPRVHDVKAVRPGRLQPLIDRINANSPADKKLAGRVPSGSLQDSTAPSGSEHDHSKQGSQKSSSNKGSSQGSLPGSPKQSSQEGSSNKGSSSQVSRPGSPNQSSHSSSQGSQLGGSKQGSPPSSDDGWQVVTGSRRRNTGRGSRNN